ncbi:olfactory receptor 10A4-like [Carettochelys insculpta]|uniref:olfactory receptor 10A4-like n=1 Tax=Carettochelys insculpta TaxID=44489 RepID=UPI003EB87C43
MTTLESHAGENQTFSDIFILVGFSYLNNLQILLFLVFLLTYFLILMGNLFIILLIKLSPSLHTPMYFFLVNLSFLEVCFTTSVIPQLLVHLLVEEKSISFLGCAGQMYIFIITGLTVSCLLATMAYDRYVAICHPLRYTTILSGRMCALLMGVSWTISISVAGAQTMWLFSQPFCGSNRIHHYFCYTGPLEKMVCTDKRKSVNMGLPIVLLFVMGPFFLIVLSYVHIISTILKLPSLEGRYKAFSTCSSHLTVVTLIYGTGILSYVKPTSSSTPESDQLISVMYTVVSPVLNPIIYTLRNKEVKGALRNILRRAISLNNRRY